jgi:hypothetical protein
MDVTCATCREPFDQYHMRHDAIWETDLPESVKRHVSNNGTTLNFPGVREALARDGWKFGSSVLAILECPCCKANAEHNGDPDSEDVANRKMQRSVLADLLGDDEDGLASMLEDLEG